MATLPKIPKDKDGRRKLTDQERQSIRAAYNGGQGIHSISRDYPFVSRRLIQFVLFPDRERKLRAIVKKEKRWLRYYHKDKQRAYMRKHRDKRRFLGLPLP